MLNFQGVQRHDSNPFNTLSKILCECEITMLKTAKSADELKNWHNAERVRGLKLVLTNLIIQSVMHNDRIK